MALSGNKCSLVVPLYGLLTRWSHLFCGAQWGNQRQQAQRKPAFYKETLFHPEDSQAVEEPVQRGCAVSILEDFQGSSFSG